MEKRTLSDGKTSFEVTEELGKYTVKFIHGNRERIVNDFEPGDETIIEFADYLKDWMEREPDYWQI